MPDIRDPDTAQAYLAQAEDMLRHNDIAGMSEALERLTTTPDCSGTYRLQAARLFVAAGATADAIRFYREAGSAFIDPEGDTARAREALNEGHALDLQDLDIMFALARVDIIEGHPRAALAKFTHIVRKSHQAHAPALFEAACIYEELGQHDQAVLMLRKVLDHDKSNVQAIVSMGQRLQSMGMLPEAVGYFVQAATAARAAGQVGTCRHMINLVLGLDSTNQNARRLLAELDDESAPEEVAPGELAHSSPAQVAIMPDSAALPAESLPIALEAELNAAAARAERTERKLATIESSLRKLEETVAVIAAELAERAPKPPIADVKAIVDKPAAASAKVKKPKSADVKKPAPDIKPRKRAAAKAKSPRR